MVKLVYIFMGRGMKKMTGRAPARGSGIEPVEIWAYQPKMLSGMGKFQQAVRKGHSVDERLKNLIELKGAQMIGCEFCVDLGSQICRNSGFSDESCSPCRGTGKATCSPSGKRPRSTTRPA